MRITDGSGLASTRAAQPNLRQAACSVGLDPSYWYPVEFDSALRHEKVIGIRFQNTSVALFRDRDGEVHAIEDRCAHRGVKLSHGFVEDCNIRCVYHGWTYSPDGKLCDIQHDLFGRPFPSVRLRTFPVQVRYGLIWMFFGNMVLSKHRHVPEIPELEAERPWVCIRRSRVWKAHPTMIVNNFIDSTHVDTLHNECKASPDSVLISQEAEQDNTRDACYEYPYLWATAGRAYKLWTFMLPLDNDTTKVFQLSLCDRIRIPYTPWLAPYWLHRFITPFYGRILVDPLLDAAATSTEMEQEGYDSWPDAASVDLHPATELCYQLTVRKWEEHLERAE